MQAQEKYMFLEDKIRESKHSYTKLAQATRQVEHYQHTLGTVKDKAIVHKTSALKSRLNLNKLQRKYKTFAKIMSTSQNRKKIWRASTKLRQATRHLDHVQCTLEKVKYKASVAEESAQNCRVLNLQLCDRKKRHGRSE
jgi:hypothetical protein